MGTTHLEGTSQQGHIAIKWTDHFSNYKYTTCTSLSVNTYGAAPDLASAGSGALWMDYGRLILRGGVAARRAVQVET